MREILLIFICSFFTIPLSAQEMLIEDLTEYYIARNGSENDISIDEHIMQIIENPVFLNLCSEEELQQTKLFTPFQAYNIIQYRKKYGNFLTKYELEAIPGIDQQLIETLSPVINTSINSSASARRGSKLLTLSNIRLITPTSIGFQQDKSPPEYPGSALKVTQRVKYQQKKITSALTYEKDPGEFAFSRYLPEHLSGYVQYESEGLIKRCIAGNYKLHRGLGLVHGTGLFSGGIDMNNGGFRRAYARPYASAMEYNYLNGIYGSFGKGNMMLDAYLSSTKEDMSLFRYVSGVDLFDLVRETGYHRTLTERNGANLGRQRQSGASMNYIHDQWNVGCAYAYGKTCFGQEGIDSLRTTVGQETVKNAFSLYGISFGKNYELLFEASINHKQQYALMINGRFIANHALTFFFDGQRIMQNFHAFNPAGGNDHENSEGIRLGIRINPGKNIRVVYISEAVRPINPLENKQTDGWKLYNRLDVKWIINQQQNIRFRARNKYIQGSFHEGEAGISKRSLDIHYRFAPTNTFKYESRLARSLIGDLTSLIPMQEGGGTAFFQQISLKTPSSFSLKYRFLTFNIPQWENRIYLYEPGLRYSFSFKAWHRRG
ncbi:MAG TPA: helix-hairpin-helix domain-containing protein, partial [Bacteroidales bacterium]|nr:helix-hairpin-helix domain-containing protein [Bacteroidales bacterium]